MARENKKRRPLSCVSGVDSITVLFFSIKLIKPGSQYHLFVKMKMLP
jgi:hypothetical protein